MKNKFSIAMSLAVILAMLLTSIGLADNLVGDALNTAPGTADNMSAVVAGGTMATYQFGALISNTGGPSDNVFPGTVNVDLTRFGDWLSSPSGIPDALNFTAYDQTQTGTVKIFVPCGSAGTLKVMTVLLAADQSSNGKSLDANKDTVTLTYNITAGPNDPSCPPPPPSNTSPTVTLTGVTDSASYAKGSVPAAQCFVIDAEDGNSTFAATLSATSGLYASDGIGDQTASCAYTDKGGLSAAPASATYTIVDPTAPSISYVVNPAFPDGADGWYKSNVTLTWTVSEPESPNSLQKTGCADQNITADQAETTYSCAALSAGGSATQVDVKIKRDATVPTITGSASPDHNVYGWNKTDVTVSFTCDDNLSGVASCSSPKTLSSEGAGQSATGNVTDSAGNTNSATVSGIKIDKTVPTASATALPAANANGWNNTDVTVSFSGTDGLSGIDACDNSITVSTEGADQSASGTCTDNAGNVSAAATATVSLDKTAPSVALVGGPANGSSYYFGFLPAAPTCSASDGLSGLDGSCTVSAYDTSVGTHTVTASATDKAGNSSTASTTYTVLGWSNNGFYQPVDMGKLNIAKNGSTVPLKFEVFAGTTELTDVSFIKKTFVQTLTCGTSVATDDIEQYTSGGTSLRYDTTGGQFVFNWQTPKSPNACFRVTLTLQDGSTISADFKLK